MRLPWPRRRRRADSPVEVGLPFMTTRWTPQAEIHTSTAAVTLGFRDGTTVTVSPESADGRALRTAAAALVDRKAQT